MSEVRMLCQRCNCGIIHHCYGKGLPEAIKSLYMWRPESGFPTALKRGNPYVDESIDSEEVPFISETFLYALLGKQDARSFMGRLAEVFREAGIDADTFQEEAYQALSEKIEAREAEIARRAAAKKAWAERHKPVKTTFAGHGYLLCQYLGFEEFDTNVDYCLNGRCMATSDSRTTRVKPKVDALYVSKGKTTKGDVTVKCRRCKRIHHAPKAQVAGWRQELGKKTKHDPEWLVRSPPLRRLLKLKAVREFPQTSNASL